MFKCDLVSCTMSFMMGSYKLQHIACHSVTVSGGVLLSKHHVSNAHTAHTY